MADLNPNEEELLILPDDDVTNTDGNSSSTGTSSDDKKTVQKAEEEELITFDDEPIVLEEKSADTPKIDIGSKLDALETTPITDVMEDKLSLLEEKSETPELKLDLDTPVDTKEVNFDLQLDEPSAEEPLIVEEVSTIDLGEETPKAEATSVETPKVEEVKTEDTALDMSALLGDDTPVVEETTVAETPKTTEVETEKLLGGLVDEVTQEAPTESVETQVVATPIDTEVGTMEEILEATVSELEEREVMIQGDLDSKNEHISELEAELKIEKNEVSHLEEEKKALKTNREKIMDMIKGVLGKKKTTKES